MDNDLVKKFAKLSDLHQSKEHSHVMQLLGWKTTGKAGEHLFYRPLGPLTIAKMQRPKTIDPDVINHFRKSHHTLTTFVEPSLSSPYTAGWSVEPFAHSATSLLNLNQGEKALLTSFSQKTRYNITHNLSKAQLKITSTPISNLSNDQKNAFLELHDVWSKRKNVIGYGQGLLDAILTGFANSGTLHLAYSDTTLVGALLILYHSSVATYYAAFVTETGNTLYAPTLLTYTAMQAAKENGCTIFDFGGIYDPRYPKMYKKWQGFTRFKAGFRPTVVTYPPTKLQLFW